MKRSQIFLASVLCKIPHVFSVSQADEVEIFCQRETVRNLRVADAELTNQLASLVILQHSAGAIAARTLRD